MALDTAWLERALTITGDFETAGDPWTAVTGDFDGMGISCGPQQVNIGSGSLQPLVKACGEALVMQAMPTLGAEMWAAAHASIPEGLRIVRRWQSGATLSATAAREIAALLDTKAMRTGMRDRAARNGETALAMAQDWTGGAADLRTFCWFFDLVTQNGGLKGLTRADVEQFKAQAGEGRADDLICDFLEHRPIQSGHDRDAQKNAALWRNAVEGARLDLLVLSHLRAGLSRPEFRHVVLNRKGTLAVGKGRVNGEMYSLD